MLTAFIDESGHSGAGRIVSVAGFVAPEEVWKDFDFQWDASLKAHHAPFLHMREFAHFRGAFVGWSEDQRRALLSSLLQTIVDHNLVAVGAAIDVVAFKQLPEEQRIGFVDPFVCCVQEIAWGFALLGRGFGGCAAVFSQQDEFAGTTNLIWSHFRASRRDFESLGPIRFDDMRSSPGLQAADLLAYEIRHFYETRAKDPASKPRHPFATIVEDQLSRGRRLIKFLPAWYLEMQASPTFYESMAELHATEAGLRRLFELWPHL
jgi:hypothetical protein